MASISVVLICAVFSYVNIDVCGHVALTYPPARRYELDFLDNSRTKPPCGMPKGSIKTSFLAGSTFTVHWHLAYAHRGGYSLRILDYLERPLLDLTPRAGGSEFVRDDVTAQKFEVHLPSDFTCENCTLQLQREAGEWGANYRFWSCADIDILTRKDYHETCSGHGFHILGRCKCHKMYSGPRCQFSDECSEDNDCGLRGKCIDINATEAPSRMCYCPHGFYGKGCNKKAPWKDKNINLGLYSRRELSKFFNLYWRVLKENGEIEFVMMVNGTSYAGIGWRPNGLTKQCKNFPVLGPPMNENAITPKPEPLPEPEPKAEDEPSPEPNPEPSAEPNPEPSPEPNPEPSPEPNPEPTAEPTGVPEPVAEPSTAAKSTSESKVETATQSSENDNRNKRVAMHSLDGFDFKNLGNDVTVKTSVSYKVSSSKGRKKRAANETTNIDNLTHLSHDHSIDLTSESILEPNSEPESTPEPKSEPEPSSEPQSESEPNSESALTLAPTSESEPSPEPKSNPEPSPEPKSDSEFSPEPNTDPEPSPEPKSKQEPMPHPKSEPEPKPTSKPKFKPKSRKLSDLSPIPTSEPTSRPKQYSTVKYASELQQPEPEPNPEPESEPEPSVEPNSTSELSFESKPEPSAEPISHSEPKPISNPEPSPAPKYEPVPTSEPSLKSVKTIPDLEPYPEPESEPESSPEPKAEPEPSLEPNADLGPEKLLVKGLKEEAGYFPDHEYAPKFDFNPMDCTDIVIGTAKGNYHRVMDYYTRDRSTPRVDSFWGGHDDITAASGFEENGVTTIMFRRKIKAKEPTDHSLVDDVMHVIWARGQEPGNYVHNPPSGLERGAAAVGDFYRPDELKYHGHGAQRGVASINFFEETKISMAGGITPLADKCGGEFRSPTNCDLANSTCDYYASWEYLGLKRGKDSVRFTIKTKHNKHWTGIGFSDNKKMSQTDAIIGWVDPRSGRPFLMDTWVSGYSAPRLDSTQDLSKASGSLIDGYTTLSFVRKRDTGDQKDLAFTDAQCLYMMFITQGGGFDPVNKRTSKHLQTPVISDDRVCIRPCGPEPIVDENEMTIEPEVPGQRLYTMLVRITGLADSFKPPAPGSKDYEDLSRQVVDNFAAAMSKSKGYQGLILNGFIQNETKAIIAELTLKSMESNAIEGSSGRSLDTTSNATDPEAQTELWQQAVRETLAQGRVGNLNVDPDFLIFEPQSLVTSRPAETAAGNARSFFGQSESKLWVVVACVAALVLLALLQAACTIHRTSRQHLGKDQLIPNSAWKDYSAANTNYAFEPFENDDKYHSTSTAPPRHRPNTPARPTEPPPPRPSSGNKTIQKAHEANGTHRANGSHRANGTHESNGNHGANSTRGANSNHGWNMTHGSTGNGRMTPKHPNSAAQYYHETRSLQRPKGQYGYAGRGERGERGERSERGERGERGDRATYSLPRGARGDPAPGLTAQPDFYFMPSQRKYEDF